MAASAQTLANITDRHADQRDSISEQLLKALVALWAAFAGWRDPDLVAGQAAQSATMVIAAQQRIRMLERSYLQVVLRDMQALPAKLPTLVNPYPRSGISPLDVYERPATQFIYALSQGSSVAEATDVATQRLTDTATQDVILAERDEAQRVYQAAPKVVGYRRVIHPELSRTGTCGLCLVASDRFYKKSTLLPLHGGCNCDTLPITSDNDPGFKLRAEDLKAVYALAGQDGRPSTYAQDLLNTRVTIDEHGELGPILRKQGDSFRTAAEAGRPPYVKPTPSSIRAAQTKALEQATSQIAELQSRYAAMPFDGDANGQQNADRVALFRSIKNLTDYSSTLSAQLKRAA
jgi:hypothetical protein